MSEWDLTLLVGDQQFTLDAADPRLIPSDLQFTTTAQGGPSVLSCGVLRTLGNPGAEKPYDRVQVLGPNGTVWWDGRLARMSRTVTGTIAKLTPSAVGLAAILEDRQDARFLGIDRDLSHWTTPTINRRIGLAASKQFDHSVANGALKLTIPGYTWTTANGTPRVEAVYDAGPLKVGLLTGTWQSGATPDLNTDANWLWLSGQADDSDETVRNIGGPNLSGSSLGAPIAYTYSPTLPAPKLVRLVLRYNATTGGSNELTYEIRWTNLAVVGSHGLSLTGTGPADYGLKASDMIAWVVKNLCTGLSVGDIRDSALGINHFAQLEPTTPAQIVQGLNAYHQWVWGVWEDGKFDFYPWGEGRSRTWYVRAADNGIQLNQDGDDAAALWTDVVVTYTDPSGLTKSVGSPFTIADATDSNLGLTDSTHPTIAAGLRRVYNFDLGQPTIQATAVSVGRVVLAQLNAARRSGSISITGLVTDESGNTYPSYAVRGGDQIVVTDIGDLNPRRVVEATYTHSNKTVQATIDNQLQTVEAIVAFLGARTVGVG